MLMNSFTLLVNEEGRLCLQETEPQITRVSEETLQMLAEGGAKTAGLLALIEKDEVPALCYRNYLITVHITSCSLFS